MKQKVVFFGGMALAVAAGAIFLVWVRQWSFAEPAGAAAPVPPPSAARLPFHPGEELEYEFGLNGIPAATLHVAIFAGRDGARDHYVLTYRLRTTRAIERLWDYEADGRTVVDSRTLLPVLSERHSKQGEREKRITTRFDRTEGVARIDTWRSHRTKRKHEVVPCAGMADIASAFLLLRTTPLRPGESFALRVLNGDDVYDVAVSPLQAASIESAAGTFDATELDLRVREIDAEGTGDTTSAQKYRRTRVWLSNGGRMPLRLESEVFVGQVYAELVGFRTGSRRD